MNVCACVCGAKPHNNMCCTTRTLHSYQSFYLESFRAKLNSKNQRKNVPHLQCIANISPSKCIFIKRLRRNCANAFQLNYEERPKIQVHNRPTPKHIGHSNCKCMSTIQKKISVQYVIVSMLFGPVWTLFAQILFKCWIVPLCGTPNFFLPAVFVFYSVIYFTRAITLHFRLLFGSNKIICFYKPSGIHSSIILFT